MKAVVVGATGVMGRRLTAELARSNDFDALVLAARDPSALARLAEVVTGAGVTTVSLDAADPSAVAAAAAGTDVIVSCAGPTYLFEPSLARAAIDAGASYVSLCDDHGVLGEVLALHDAAAKVDVTIVPGCGLSPGITNLLAVMASREMDEVHHVEISAAVSTGDASGPAATHHLLFALGQDAPTVADGQETLERGASSPKRVYFPEPVGWVETFVCGHPEVSTLPGRFDALRSLLFRIGLTEKAAMDLVRASVLAGVTRHETALRGWVRTSQPLKPLLRHIPPVGAAWTAARVDVWGTAGDRETSTALAVVDHLANLATTPLAYAARALAADPTLERGVLAPEHLFNASSFLKHLDARGIRIARLEPQPV